jgi:hypothetical protein
MSLVDEWSTYPSSKKMPPIKPGYNLESISVITLEAKKGSGNIDHVEQWRHAQPAV